MRAVNLDTLVSVGHRPWRPTAEAHDVDVWDKYDFPNCGTYRLGNGLVVFTLITTASTMSLWAYVPVPADSEKYVTNVPFITESEFDAFVEDCFAGHEVVFAEAADFVITSKSDGIAVPPGKNGLLLAGVRWYVSQARDRAANESALVDTALGALAGRS